MKSPKKPAENLASSWPVNEENHIAIHDHNSENRVASEHAGDDCFPLCFSSFELLNQIFRVTNQPQKYDIMDEDISFLEWMMRKMINHVIHLSIGKN